MGTPQTIAVVVGVLALVFGIVYAFVGVLGAQLTGLGARLDSLDRSIDRQGVFLGERIDQQGRFLGGRLDAVESRLQSVESGLSDLRVDVARVGQKLDDHVLDPTAHAA